MQWCKRLSRIKPSWKTGWPRRRPLPSRGLRRLIEDNDGRGIRQDLLNRVRNILTVLILAPSMEDVRGPPGWRVHQLTGDRCGTWSVSVSSNWRITFDLEDDEILNLDLEDYH
jgi:proteic killer suppression protein